jgi:prolyl oligopeptidase
MTIYVRETSKPHLPSKERGSDPGRMDDVIEHNRFFTVIWTSDSKGSSSHDGLVLTLTE